MDRFTRVPDQHASDKRMASDSNSSATDNVSRPLGWVFHVVGKLKFEWGIAPALIGFAFVVFFSIPAWEPLTNSGYFVMHDDAPAAFIYEMDRCFDDGQFPCRWAQDIAAGGGAPLFNLQAPLAYYVGELVHLSGFSLLDSVKIAFILGFLVAGGLMYLLAREFWGSLGGVVSGVFYVFAPYLALDVYVGGKLAEVWAIALFPGILWGIYKVVREGKFHHVLLLSLFISLLLLSHNLMVLIFVPVALLWAAIILAHTANKRTVFPLLLSGLWGLGLAAFFILPLSFEVGLTHAQAYTSGYFDYHRHFVTLNQLFIERFWSFGTSQPGPDDTLSFQIGWLHWSMAGVALLAAPFLWLRNRVAFWAVLAMVAVFGLAVFLMTERSLFIWEAIPVSKWMQFPWRLLALAIFTTSFLAGSLFALLKNSKLLAFVLSLALIGVVTQTNEEFFQVKAYFQITDEEKYSGSSFDSVFNHRFLSYSPIANRVRAIPGVPMVEVLEGDTQISNTRQGSDSLAFAARSQGDTKVRISVTDYPNWRVRVDGRVITHTAANAQGLITFDLPRGSHDVSVKLENTQIRTFADYLSIVSWTLFILAWPLWMTRRLWRRFLPDVLARVKNNAENLPPPGAPS